MENNQSVFEGLRPHDGLHMPTQTTGTRDVKRIIQDYRLGEVVRAIGG